MSADLTDRYELQRQLGEGAMGSIWLAKDKVLDRPVAVKFIHDELDETGRARFIEEATSQARLVHPNIVALITFGGQDKVPYIIFEYIEGPSLQTVIEQKGPQPLGRAVKWAIQLCDAMAFSHDAGILHRDLKSDNVLICGGQNIRLTDFGLAKRADRTRDLTNTGMVMGTPAYMSPEQAKGQKATPQSDIYGAGVILFEMLTGRLPFEEESLAEMVRAHLYLPPPDPRVLRPKIPERLAAIVLRALNKERGARLQSFRAFKGELQKLPKASLAASGRKVACQRRNRLSQKTVALKN